MSVTVGTLTIDLKANTASFTSEMSKMSQLSARTANDVKRSLEKIAAAGLAMGAAVATGTVALIKSALDTADEMGKLAQSAGTTAETLSVLAYGAKLSGLQVDQLGMGLTRLSKAAFAAQNGNVQLERIFGRMGVSVSDSNGHLKDSGELMQQLATKFASTADGAGKTAIAMQLFGKSGAALIPFLDQYGAKQEEINAAAHQFGLVLGTSTVQLAAQAKEKIESLKIAAAGFGYTVLGSTLPALDKLSSQLIKVAEDANIPDLGKAFGEKVVTAVTGLGNALVFVEKHAQATKVALEALAGLKLATIAIPVISDLANGGLDKATSGIGRFILQSIGLTNKVIPAFMQLASSAKYNASFISLMASEEGIAAAASYAWTSGIESLNAALGTTAGLLGVVTAGLGIFGAALVSEKSAAEKLAGTAVTWGDMWHAAMENVMDDAHVLLDLLKGDLPKALKDLSSFQSLRTRAAEEAKARPVSKSELPPPPPPSHKPTFDTAGLGKPKKDIFGDEIRQLDLAIQQQQAYLDVISATPEKIAEVAAAEKARAVILELSNKLIDEGRLKQGQLIPTAQQAAIQQRVAQEESLKSLVDYGKELVSQQHSSDLAIQQTRAMAAANLDGDEAIRRATIDNAILGLTYNKTAEQLRLMTPELAKLRDFLTAKSDIDIVAGANKAIDGLRDQLTERQILTAATLDSLDAQRQADLGVKTFALDQQIAAMGAGAAKDALVGQRQAMIDLAHAENAQSDAQSALSLLSPADQYDKETDSLNHAVAALKALQDGSLTYGESLQIAAKQQDEFNKATDQTVELLLREGSLGDGVTAFFLKMQEQAKTTAATIYDAFNETFSKLSDDLTAFITAPNRWGRQKVLGEFGQTFEDLGKNLLDNQIKQGAQGGLGALGKAFHITLPGVTGKLDGSSSQNALWVRWATANGSPVTGLGQGSSVSSSGEAPGIFSGNELNDLLGAPAAPSAASARPESGGAASGIAGLASQVGSATKNQPGPVGVFGGLLSAFAGLLGLKRPAQTGVLSGETLGFPSSTFGTTVAPDGGNELDNLTGSSSSANIPAALRNVPTLIRRYADSNASLPATVMSVPDLLSSADDTSSGSSDDSSGSGMPASTLMSVPAFLPAVSPTMMDLPALPGLDSGSSANGLSPMPGLSDDSKIPSAPDVQPKTISQVVQGGPSPLDKFLAAGLAVGTKVALPLFFGKQPPDLAGTSDEISSIYAPPPPGRDNAFSNLDPSTFAGGGRVFGAGTGTSDSIPARLSHGEYVINAASTAKHLPMLHAINNGTMKFAMGGYVGFDDGGFVSPSAAYLPASGASGMPSGVAGAIASNASSARGSSGDTHHWSIDARGSTDPAQVTAQLDRYMRTAAPQIAAMAIRGNKDQQLRRAPSAR